MLNQWEEECVVVCRDCATACRQLAAADASRSDSEVTDLAERIRAACECMDICHLTAQWLEQGARFTSLLCEVSALVCTTTADRLATSSDDDARRCEKSCRTCADVCRRFVGGAVPEIEMSVGIS